MGFDDKAFRAKSGWVSLFLAFGFLTIATRTLETQDIQFMAGTFLGYLLVCASFSWFMTYVLKSVWKRKGLHFMSIFPVCFSISALLIMLSKVV